MSSTRNQGVIRNAKKLQPYCSRCSSRKSLHGHHIHALADGGPDTVENISVLCSPCHKDWHAGWEGCVSFDEFLDTIPADILSRLQRQMRGEDWKINEAEASWRLVRDAMRDDDEYAAIRGVGEAFLDGRLTVEDGRICGNLPEAVEGHNLAA